MSGKAYWSLALNEKLEAEQEIPTDKQSDIWKNLVCWKCPLVVCWEVRKTPQCHAWCKTSNILSQLGKKCIWHWAVTWRCAYWGVWQSLYRLAKSASEAARPPPGTLDFHCSRWIFAEARPWWAQSAAGGEGLRLEMLLSDLHASKLGNI